MENINNLILQNSFFFLIERLTGTFVMLILHLPDMPVILLHYTAPTLEGYHTSTLTAVFLQVLLILSKKNNKNSFLSEKLPNSLFLSSSPNFFFMK